MESLWTNSLSICIPTYNRYPFLKWTVERAQRDFPGAKIIVSDNCSTDATQTLISEAKYILQPENIGAFPNMREVLLAATTKYCLFLGDDDYLLPEEVEKGVAFLEAHPEVNVYFAPCQLYDEVEQKPAFDAFYVANDETFSRPDALWNFVINNHVWPEHAIYRRAGLEKIMQPRVRPYWCFVDLGNAALTGAPIHFAKTPYYRNITNHPVGQRGKLGDVQCLTDFEEYRSGLELLAYALFSHFFKKEKGLQATLNDNIRQFIFARLEVARRILLAQNRPAEAEVLERRMVVTGY